MADDHLGARFIGRFTKNREGDEAEAGPWQWSFSTHDRQTEVHHARMDNIDVLVQHIRDGLESCSDIALEMGVTKGAVSKWAKRAAAAGLIRIEAGKYRVP